MELIVTKQSGGYDLQFLRDGIITGTQSPTNGSPFTLAMTNATITGIAFRHSQTPSAITFIDDVSVTISIGVIQMRTGPTPESLEELFQRVDKAMYDAKESGRNCIVIDDL